MSIKCESGKPDFALLEGAVSTAGHFAASINPEDLPIVVRYVKNQERHHRDRTLIRKLECPDD